MSWRRDEARSHDPLQRFDGPDESMDGWESPSPGAASREWRRPARYGYGDDVEPEAPSVPWLTLPSIPRMPRAGDSVSERYDARSREAGYPELVSLHEPAVLVPGKDSGKFAVARRTAKIPALHRSSPAAAPYAEPRRDGWDRREPWGGQAKAPTRRAVALPPGRRATVSPQASEGHARSRWRMARYVLAVIALVAAVITTIATTGQWGQQPSSQIKAESGPVKVIAQQVRPLTSLLVPQQYDSRSQYNLYSGAACSPTVLAEVLTAWGVPNITIGRMIDELGSYLSPTDGLLDQAGFQAVAAKHQMRADISWHMTYDQILYLTNVLGIPVIVNFRSCSGYYFYLCGGHFLAVTGGDENGVHVVDSSEYYMKYLTRSTFDSLWYWRGDGTAMTVVIVPQNYQYTLPNS